MTTEQQLQSMLQIIDRRERTARLRAILYALIPIAIAIVIIIYTYYQISTAALKVDALKQELTTTQITLTAARVELVQVNQEAGELELAATQAELRLADTEKLLEETQSHLNQVSAEAVLLKKEVERYRGEAEQYQREVIQLQVDIEKLQSDFKQIEENIREVSNFDKYKYLGDINYALKYIGTYEPSQNKSDLLFDMIFDQRDTPWKLGGVHPDEGFDSPGFAAYMLEKHNLLSEQALDVRYRLREVLPSVREPMPGDLVFYRMGYTMFYYEDEQGQPFVVGMTPAGVVVLQYNFAEILGYASP